MTDPVRLSDLRRVGMLSQELIDLLHEHYPDEMPYGCESHDEIQQAIGRTQIIRLLETWKKALEDPESFKQQQTETVFKEL